MLKKLTRTDMINFPVDAVYTPPMNRPIDFFVLDFETSGLNPSKDFITEVAIVRVNNNRIVGNYSSLVQANHHQSSEIVKLTGITDEMLVEAPPIEMVAKKLGEFIGTRSSPIFCHNARFDCKFLFSHGIADAIEANCPICCSLELAQTAYPHEPSFSLKNLAVSLELHYPNPHRAEGDVYCTAQLIDVCYAKIEEDKGLRPRELNQTELNKMFDRPPCPTCGSPGIHRAGFTRAGTQVYLCNNCGKKYSNHTQPGAKPKRLKARTTLMQARKLYGDNTLHCTHCSSIKLTIKEHKGVAHRFFCKDCRKTMTFYEDE